MKTGFTLIELLVVVLIIGILSVVALPKYEQAVLKSRYTSLIALTESMRKANEAFKLANGFYALDFTQLDIDMPAGWTLDSDNRWAKSPGKKIQCTLNDGSSNDSGPVPLAYCVTNNIYYFSNYDGSRYCGSYTENGIRVCQSLGGVKTGGLGLWYKLP